MKLQDILYERNKTTPMKNANEDTVMISYYDGSFWFGDNGEEDSTNLGSTIKDAKKKLKESTNNSYWVDTIKSQKDIKDENTIEKSIDRHFKKLQKNPDEKFNFMDIFKEGINESKKELKHSIFDDMVDANQNGDYNEARVIIAKAISDLDGNTDLLDKYKSIQNEHIRLTHMPYKLIKKRSELDKQLKKHIIYSFTNSDEIIKLLGLIRQY